jgi:hypothetical protein
MERVKGIEPSYSAWKAAALPLSYTRPPGRYARWDALLQRGRRRSDARIDTPAPAHDDDLGLGRHCEARNGETVHGRGLRRMPERLRPCTPLDGFASLAMTTFTTSRSVQSRRRHENVEAEGRSGLMVSRFQQM